MTVMTRIFNAGAALLTAAALTGCATLPVHATGEPNVDFSRFTSYTLAPPTEFVTGDPRLDSNTLFEAQLQSAIEVALAARGFMADDARPDLLIQYHATVRQEVELSADPKRPDGGTTGTQSGPYVFDAGMVTIDVVDSRTNRVVWRGWSEPNLDGAIDDQAWLGERINETVRRIFDKLPRRL